MSHNGEALLEHYCRAGVPAPETARRLRAAGHDISAATVGRRYQELRGNVRSSSKAVRAMARPVAPPPPVQSEADASRLAALLQQAADEPEPEAEEPMVEWLAELLDAPADDGADVVFARVPAACLAELAAPEHVRRALACVALVSTDDGEPGHLARARAVLVGASGELATVQAAHFPAEEPEAEEPTS